MLLGVGVSGDDSISGVFRFGSKENWRRGKDKVCFVFGPYRPE